MAIFPNLSEEEQLTERRVKNTVVASAPPLEHSNLVLVCSLADKEWCRWLKSWIASPVLVAHQVIVDEDGLPDQTFWELMALRPQHTCVLVFVSPHLATLYDTNMWKRLWQEMHPCQNLLVLAYLGDSRASSSPENALPGRWVELHAVKGEEERDRLAIYDVLTGTDPGGPRAPYPGKRTKGVKGEKENA